MVPYYSGCCQLIIRLLLCATVASAAGMLDVEYSWTYAEYEYSSPQQRDSAIKSRRFIPENCVILDVDVFQDNLGERIAFYNTALFPQRPAPKQRVFVTIPRIKPGNPASLAEVVPGDRPGSVLLSPYPSWKANTVVEERVHCDDTIVSVFRTKIDDLGRFWVLDTGSLDQFETTPRAICPPKLVIFDLKNNNHIIRMYKFSLPKTKEFSLFTNIVVDNRDPKGRNAFAYISDTTAFKLVVYDYKNDDSWIIDQAYFYPYPNKAHYNINGVTFDLMDGLLGLALGPVKKNDRKLYFHPFSSSREAWVHASVLQNKSLFSNGLIDGSGTFFVSGEVRETQSSVEVMTDKGILIYASMDNSLSCWNSQDPFLASHIHPIYKNDEDFQFPSGMKIIGDKLWAVSCQLQNHFTTAPANRKSIKYRVLVGQVDELIKGTGCDKRTKVDKNEDEFLVESFGGNMLREWRAVPNTPWSYSRMSRVFEDKDAAQQTNVKSLVLTGNVNLHGPSKSRSTSLSYDCRMSILVDGQLKSRDCVGKTRRMNQIKRKSDPLR